MGNEERQLKTERLVSACIDAARHAVLTVVDDLHSNRVADAAYRLGQINNLLQELAEELRGRGW
jgi:hypothetical protein